MPLARAGSRAGSQLEVGPPEDGRVSPRKNTGGFLNGSLGEGETKERFKNAFKHVQSRHFAKASDLFRKKKKAKIRQHHSIHLAVPDDPGETTTDFEEADSDASTDNRLDEGTLFTICHLNCFLK